MKDLLLAGGAIFVLLYVHKQQQAAVAPSHSMNPTNQNTPATNMPIIGGGGGGGLDVGGGGFLGGGGGGFNPADLAWQFADWVDSIPLGGYEQITGVVNVPAEHTSIDEHMNQ